LFECALVLTVRDRTFGPARRVPSAVSESSKRADLQKWSISDGDARRVEDRPGAAGNVDARARENRQESKKAHHVYKTLFGVK
jgi:hypothetical protein